MSDLVVADHALPTGSAGYRSSGFYGMFFLILSEGALFAYLLFSYFYFSVQPPAAWPPGGPPNLHISLPNTVILLVSSGFVWWGERAIRIGNHRHLPIALAIGLVLGIIFVGLQFVEWHNKPFRLSSSTYSSLFFTITGVPGSIGRVERAFHSSPFTKIFPCGASDVLASPTNPIMPCSPVMILLWKAR